MKKTYSFILVFVFLICSCSSNQSIENITISGKITNNNEYHGGANPPQDILDALALYTPSANQLFYVRYASNYTPFTPIITSFSTNANGDYTLDLPTGSYAVICQEKYEFEQNPLASSSCNYIQEPDFILTVVNTPQAYDCIYTAKANFCLSYPE